MARQRLVEAALVNIALVEHSKAAYSRLIEEMYSARRPIKIRGSEYMMLTSIEKPVGRSSIYSGVFVRFTEIDSSLPWFDITTLKEAAESDLAAVRIPDNLRPNYSPFFFQFDLSGHLFVFEARGGGLTVAPQQVEKFLRLLARAASPDTAVSINLVAEESAVDTVLALASLKHLTIVVELPNPDLNNAAEREVRRRLARMGAKRQTEILDAIPGQSLQPDASAIRLAEVAAANGEVRSAGHDEEGLPKRMSTKSYPLKAAYKYNPDLTSEQQAFDAAAEEAKRRRDQLFDGQS